MNRRNFAFWLGMGLFGLSERLNLHGLDRLAASAMLATEPKPASGQAVHWSVAENATWRWLERENLVNGTWKLTGITTPINRQTGEKYTGKVGYLDDALAPAKVRFGRSTQPEEAAIQGGEDTQVHESPGEPLASRRARHGRPPSRWLRSLNSDELRLWLETIEVPEAGVSGMTFWTHLTRDHSFSAVRIDGLDEAELAKLHSAAHAGY